MSKELYLVVVTKRDAVLIFSLDHKGIYRVTSILYQVPSAFIWELNEKLIYENYMNSYIKLRTNNKQAAMECAVEQAVMLAL
jgi:hypothetical protein